MMASESLAPTAGAAAADNPLLTRLAAARRTVEEAASDALCSAEIDETVVGRVGSGGVKGTTTGGTGIGGGPGGAGGGVENEDPNRSAVGEVDGDDDDDDAYDDGDGRSSAAAFQLGMTLFGDDVSAIERDVSDRLEAVEAELRDLARTARGGGAAAAGAGAAGGSARGAATPKDDDDDDGPLDAAALDAEARALAAKASFLRRCSAARAAIDEEERLSLSLSAEAASSGSGGSGSLVESARLLSAAEDAVREAEDGLVAAEAYADANTNAATGGGGGNGTKTAADLDAARRIVASIRSQVRRRRSELRYRASAAVDRSVQITAEGIHVTVGSTSAAATAAASGTGTTAVKANRGDTLSDAYDAMAMLSEEGLDDAVHLLCRNLYDLVLEPVVAGHVEAFEKGTAPPRYTLSQTESSRGTAAVSKTVAGGGGRGGGTTHKLVWTRKGGGAATPLASKQSSSTSTSSSTPGGMEAIAAWSHVLDVIATVLKFVRRRILLDRSDLCHTLGRYLFGGDSSSSPTANAGAALLRSTGIVSSTTEGATVPLFEKMVRAMWDTCLPTSPSLDVLADLPQMGDAMCIRTGAFERDLIELDLLAVEDTKAAGAANDDDDGDDSAMSPMVSPLSDFASNFERRYGEKRRALILSQGRDVLLQGDYHNTVTVGVDVYENRAEVSVSPLDFDEADDGMSVFALHRCSVSQVASDLMDLCTKTMDDAVDPRCCAEAASNALLPPQLYRTARELLDLYRAIIPAAHGGEIASVPRTAAVLHNDCVFFAHRCLTFGLEYRDKFPSTGGANAPHLRQLCTFVDLVPPFRELAERTMGEMIERHKVQLSDIVGSRISILGDALRSNESVVEWTDAETALTAGTYHLRHLSQAWRVVLSRDIYDRAMGTLVDAIFALYLDQVMNAHDISEPSSHFIGALFRNATRTVSELFADGGTPSSSSSSTTTESVASRRARISCNLWDKFSAVGGFMFMSLADITAGLAGGTFRSVTGPELSKLIVAAFDDSEKRRVLLRALSSDGKV